ncbi:MAG: carbon-nitrogen hydrolase [Thermoguttaceae bacterium]
MSINESSRFTVGLIQMAMAGQREENLARAQDRIVEAAARGARVICLPELFLSPYFCQVEDFQRFDLAETIPGPATEVLGALAARLDVTLVAPIFEKRAPGVYHNSAAVLDNHGRLAGHYRKMHIPDDPAFYEKFYFTPGDLGFLAVPTPWGRLGILICWDQWFPEAARLTAMAGADILLYPTAIGWHPEEKPLLGTAQREAWITVQRAHAIANGVFVAAVNRVGLEMPSSGLGSGIEFWGSSFLAGPFGQILAQAPQDAEAIVTVEVDLDCIEATRRGWPFWRDRRIDAYGPLVQRFLDRSP